jgi:ribosomal protein L35AE/L33A
MGEVALQIKSSEMKGDVSFKHKHEGPFSRRGHVMRLHGVKRSFVGTTQEGFKTQTLNDALLVDDQ